MRNVIERIWKWYMIAAVLCELFVRWGEKSPEKFVYTFVYLRFGRVGRDWTVMKGGNTSATAEFCVKREIVFGFYYERTDSEIKWKKIKSCGAIQQWPCALPSRSLEGYFVFLE